MLLNIVFHLFEKDYIVSNNTVGFLFVPLYAHTRPTCLLVNLLIYYHFVAVYQKIIID